MSRVVVVLLLATRCGGSGPTTPTPNPDLRYPMRVVVLLCVLAVTGCDINISAGGATSTSTAWLRVGRPHVTDAGTPHQAS